MIKRDWVAYFLNGAPLLICDCTADEAHTRVREALTAGDRRNWDGTRPVLTEAECMSGLGFVVR